MGTKHSASPGDLSKTRQFFFGGGSPLPSQNLVNSKTQQRDKTNPKEKEGQRGVLSSGEEGQWSVLTSDEEGQRGVLR